MRKLNPIETMNFVDTIGDYAEKIGLDRDSIEGYESIQDVAGELLGKLYKLAGLEQS